MTIIRNEGSGDVDLGGFYNGATTNSLRFPATSGGGYLSKTFDNNTPGNDWTFSTWLKRSALGTWSAIFYSTSTSNPYYQSGLAFNSSDQLRFYGASNMNNPPGNSNTHNDVTSTAKFRDTSAWYHIVVQRDDNGNTVIYVNNIEVASVSSSSHFRYINGTSYPHYLGNYTYQSNPGGNFHGYMADTHFVDNALVAPSVFAETKEGVWIPIKDPSVSDYGDNGFRLEYKGTGTATSSGDVANPTNIGDDSSTKNNHWDVTTLVGSDVVTDTPENNFCTLNPLNANDHIGEATFSEGNLRIESTSGNRGFTTGTMKIHGKVYFEVLSKDGNNGFAGIADIENALNGGNGQSMDMYGGTPRTDGSYHSDTGTYDDGDIVGVAVDVDAKSIEFFNNNSSVFSDTYTTDAEYFPFIHDGSGGRSMDAIANFGQDSSFAGEKTAQGNTDDNGNGDFYYSPPSGYLALCAKNLPEPIIGPNSDTNCDDHFEATLYTSDNIGSGGTQNVTNVNFQPDIVWLKNRDSDSTEHTIYDSIRTTGGNSYHIATSGSAAQVGANSQYGYLSAFNSNGFTLTGGSTNANYVNQSTDKYIAYNWKLNGGTTSSYTPTGASAAVTRQSNTTAGFSMIKYTGTGTDIDTNDQVLGHGLQVDGTDTKPDMMIFKAITTYTSGSWAVWHKDMTGNLDTDYMLLNNTHGSVSTSDNIWGGTSGTYGEPTTTLAYIGYDWNVNKGPNASGTGNTAGDYVAYFFASIEQFSKFGKYTGNGNADGALIYTGFRPAWVVTKRTDTTGNWYINDSARSSLNPTDSYGDNLYVGLANAESGNGMDILSNGFKIRNTDASQNASGGTYLYMAFAEMPFKYANAR